MIDDDTPAAPSGRHAPKEGRYRKVSVRMYGDAKFMRLTPLLASGQALWIYLLTGPHTGQIPGVFVAGRAAMAEALAWTSRDFEKALAEVLAQGLVEFDPKTRLWLIPNAIHHNAPPNPNVVKSWRVQWMQLPECDLRDRIGKHLSSALSEMSEPLSKAFNKVCGKAFEKPSMKATPDGIAIQETGDRKQEQEQEQQEAPPPTLSTVPIASVAAEASVLPDWIPICAWDTWLAMRVAIKKPATSGDIRVAVSTLTRFKAAGMDPAEVLDQSTLSNWPGLFPIKAPAGVGQRGGVTGESASARRMRERHHQLSGGLVSARDPSGPPAQLMPAQLYPQEVRHVEG